MAEVELASQHIPKPSAEAVDVRSPQNEVPPPTSQHETATEAAPITGAPCPGCASLPRITMRYDLNHSVKVKKGRKNDKPPNIFSLAREVGHSAAHSVYRKMTGAGSHQAGGNGDAFDETIYFELKILEGVKGVLRPGRPTALLAAPGAGSSTFLRLISAQEDLQPRNDTLTYNGSTQQELEGQGINLKRLSSFCADFEAHEPLLTTLETFSFAHRCLNAKSIPKDRKTHRHLTTSRGNGNVEAEDSSADAEAPLSRCFWCTPKIPEEMLRILDLDEARDTYVGSNMIRGISGGQKRRVTIGETLLMHSRINCFDAATSGLDASTAYKVCKYVCEFTRETGGIAVMSLQQPTVETFLLFSDVILLSEGRELYHGPVDRLEPYLNSLGFVRPRFLDIADFASEVVADPLRAAELSINDRLDKALTALYGESVAAASQSKQEGHVFGAAEAHGQGEPQQVPQRRQLQSHELQEMDGFPLPSMFTIRELSDYWRASPSAASLLYGDSAGKAGSPVKVEKGPSATGGATEATLVTTVPAAFAPSPVHLHTSPQAVSLPVVSPSGMAKPAKPTDAGNAGRPMDVNEHVGSSVLPAASMKGVQLVTMEDRWRYGFHNSPGRLTQARLTIGRQLTLNRRNKGYTIARWANAALMGVILATVALNPPLANAPLRIGLSLYSVIFVAFANSAEMPVILNSRSVVYKQTAAGFYTPFAFIAGSIIGTMPVALVADLIFSNLVYWLTGFAPEFTRYLFYLLILFLMDMLVAGIFRTMMVAGKQQDASQAVGMAVISIFMLSSGFFVIRSQLPPWLQWLPWISFFWYSISALANNEFHASRWNTPSPQNPDQTAGQVLLSQYDIPYSELLQWMAVLYLFCCWILVGWILSPLALAKFRFDKFPGTIRRTVVTSPDPESVLVATGVVKLDLKQPPTGTSQDGAVGREVTATGTDGPVTAPSSGYDNCGVASTRSKSRSFEALQDQSSGAGFAPASTGSAGASAGPGPGDISGAFGNCGLPAIAGTGSGATLPAPPALAGSGLDFGTSVPAPARGQSAGGELPSGAESASGGERHDGEGGVTLSGGQLLTHAGPTFSSGATGASYQLASAGGGAAGDFFGSQPVSGEGQAVALPSAGTGDTEPPDHTPQQPQASTSVEASKTASTVDFQKVAIAWRDVSYWVPTKAGDKQLLHDISGYALPYTTTCLMGASGAGKSTLLDVLLGRKTLGRTSGSITLNGVPANKGLLQSLTAFAEQDDIHLGTATVEEALEFSAKLRMPKGVTAKQRQVALGRITRVLELEAIQSRLVGTLSKNELKRLTIGVELSKLPSIVACDEPTSFLSANNAAVVIKALRRVAKTGRTIIATIHQPSSDIFISGFDNLILLAPSGRLAYFGPIGHNAMTMVRYFEGLTPLFRLPPSTNPASWMIAVVDGDVSVFGKAPADASEGKGKEAPPMVQDAGETKSTATTAPVAEFAVPEASATAMVVGAGAAGTGSGSIGAQRHDEDANRPLAPSPGARPMATASKAVVVDDASQPHWHCGSDFTPVWFEKRYQESALWREQQPKVERLMSLAQQSNQAALVPQQPNQGSGGSAPQDDVVMYQGVQLAKLDPAHPTRSHKANFASQYVHVQQRANTDWWRSAGFQLTRVAVILFLSVLLGIMFMDVSFQGFQGTQSSIGFFLTGVTYPSILFFTAAITARFERREVFYRERAAGFYGPETFTLSSLFADIPYLAVMLLVSVSITYWMIGLRPDAGSFFFMYLCALVLGYFFLATGLAYTGLCPVLPIAQLLGGLTISISFLFSGLFIPFSVIPGFWVGLYYAMPTSHILRALAVDQFYCQGGVSAGCPQISVVSGPNGETEEIGRYEYVARFLGTTFQKRWGELGWAALAGAVMTVIALLAYRFINHQKK